MKTILLSLLTAVSFAASAAAQSLVPARINYQAFVTDDAGVPFGNTAPTNHDVTFRIYNNDTTPAIVWAERQTVTIHQGRFSVLLGNGVQDGSNPRPPLDTLFGAAPGTTVNGKQLSIGITVNALGQNTAAEFSPRQQLVANPLALRAASAAVADTVAGNSINSAAIVDSSITGADLVNGTITVTQLGDNSVTNAKMADNAVGNAEMADNAVNTTELVNGAVTTAKLADTAVSSAKLADNAVTNAKMADNAVGTTELASNAVTSVKLADTAVTSAKLADTAVTEAKLAANAVTNGKLASDVNSLSKVSGGRISATSGTGPITITTSSTSNSGDWDILLNDSGGHTAGIRIVTGTSSSGFLDMTNSAVLPNTVGGTGYARLNSVGEWSTISDRRLKRDIAPLDGLLNKALALQPVTYHFKTDADNDAVHMGFIAQDVQAVTPSLVTNGETLTMNYAGMSTVAIGAIKEQHTIVEGQGERIESLEKENADLKARLERLEKALGTIK